MASFPFGSCIRNPRHPWFSDIFPSSSVLTAEPYPMAVAVGIYTAMEYPSCNVPNVSKTLSPWVLQILDRFVQNDYKSGNQNANANRGWEESMYQKKVDNKGWENVYGQSGSMYIMYGCGAFEAYCPHLVATGILYHVHPLMVLPRLVGWSWESSFSDVVIVINEARVVAVCWLRGSLLNSNSASRLVIETMIVQWKPTLNGSHFIRSCSRTL